jgi:hypothetical protein
VAVSRRTPRRPRKPRSVSIKPGMVIHSSRTASRTALARARSLTAGAMSSRVRPGDVIGTPFNSVQCPSRVQTPINEHPAQTARAAAARPGNTHDLLREAQEAPSCGGAPVAEETVGRGERGTHPLPPFVVLEHRRHREHAVPHWGQTTSGNPMRDRLVADPSIQKLMARDPVELAPRNRGDLSVPHARKRALGGDSLPPPACRTSRSNRYRADVGTFGACAHGWRAHMHRRLRSRAARRVGDPKELNALE